MKTLALAFAVVLVGIASQVYAFPQHDRRELDEIIVTGSFVTQGGAKDVNYLRGEVEQARIPHPETFTAEGLLSEHSVVLASSVECRQVFCLVGESIDADLITQPEARYLVGIGFTTNVQRDNWRRRPLNLIAVVDKSGSMDGTPLELVRKSLTEVLRHMKSGDQLSVVLYGDTAHVYLEPTPIERDSRARIQQSIDAIASAGSTAMERGLELGYDVARRTATTFDGTTRVMLFTDERPNVGNTHAMGFMSMARAASQDSIGLTTIGVGVQFDAALATTIGSVRGGNLFFMRDEGDVRQVFRDDFDYMVSELAHDLAINVTPQAGYNVSGVFGVPNQLLGWQNERTVKIALPTVFLSSKGGALFVALAKSRQDAHLPARPMGENAPLATISVSYTQLSSGKIESDRIDVFGPAKRPSDGMSLGHTLIDEFSVLHRALTAHHIENDQTQAHQYLQALATRLADSSDPRLDNERELVYSLEERFAFLSGRGNEPLHRRSRMAKLWGVWEVRSIQGKSSLRARERLEFSPNSEFRRFEKRDGTHVVAEAGEFGANRRQIVLEDSGLVFDYEVRGNELVLADGAHDNLVFLSRSRVPESYVEE